jgi:hypothetical protein
MQRLQVDVEDKKAQLRALGKEMEQRDADVARLMGELNVTNSQAQIMKHQVCSLDMVL